MTASDVLEAVLRVNLAAGGAILLVLALRRAVRPRLGARLAYGLWLLPLLAAAAVLVPPRTIFMVISAPAESTGPALHDVVGATAPTAQLDPVLLLMSLWLAGILVAGLIMIHLQRQFTREAAKGAVGPAVVGVIAPRIVLPRQFEQMFTDEERPLVLAHEQAHLARQDSRLNALSAAIQCLFWFNPLIHLAAHLARIDQEMACDEAVIARVPKARRLYAQALVKAQLATRPLPLGCCWPSGTEHPLEERIAMLKMKVPDPRHRLAAVTALALMGAATGMAAWAAQPPRTVIETPAAPSRATTAPGSVQSAQPPEAAGVPRRPPRDICLTNSCVETVKVAAAYPSRNSAAVARAVRAGDLRGILQGGGNASDLSAGWRARCEQSADPICAQIAPGTESFVVTPGGTLGVQAVIPGQGGSGVRLPDGAGLPLPPDVPAWEMPALPDPPPGYIRETIPSADGQSTITRTVRAPATTAGQ